MWEGGCEDICYTRYDMVVLGIGIGIGTGQRWKSRSKAGRISFGSHSFERDRSVYVCVQRAVWCVVCADQEEEDDNRTRLLDYCTTGQSTTTISVKCRRWMDLTETLHLPRIPALEHRFTVHPAFNGTSYVFRLRKGQSNDGRPGRPRDYGETRSGLGEDPLPRHAARNVIPIPPGLSSRTSEGQTTIRITRQSGGRLPIPR